ncbi:MAG TPA: flagellar hook protein FlgE [Acidobacteriaceae bacterium]|jgi:flagellar hook protein FlgE|nr:flagellar hook protein FlgE [Acidobacteriaceae bacterium]
MSAFSIPLSGLAASSDSLNVIANNLSNLNTDGYKDESLNFADVFNQVQGVSGNGDPIQIGSGVQIDGQTSNLTNGTVSNTGIASNVALQGNGFFVVQGAVNGLTSFTRSGDFTVNSQGQLVSQSGQLVMGYPAVNGVVSTSSALGPISVNQASNIPAVSTSSFSMDTNLNAGAAVGDQFSTPITVYDSLGTSHVLNVTYTNTAASTWSYNISIPSSDVGGTGTATTLATGTLTFDSSGNLTSPASPVAGINISGLADGAAPMNLSWSLTGSGGASYLTQQDATSATSSTSQNGYGVGTLTGYSILSDGTVEGQFSNNQTLSLGKLAVASFANPQGLTELGGNDFQATFASGTPNIGQAGAGGNGTITGGAVEESNVNLSTEFANMIVAQQTYEANAKVLTTMDQVSQATIQLIQ